MKSSQTVNNSTLLLYVVFQCIHFKFLELNNYVNKNGQGAITKYLISSKLG